MTDRSSIASNRYRGVTSQLNSIISWQRHQDGSWRTLEGNTRMANGKYYSVARDITEQISTNQEIEYLSYHDMLTGLCNRRFLDEEIHRLNRGRHLPVSVIMADVDRLKLMNDAFGHEAGDELIQRAAFVISDSCRPERPDLRWGD